MQTQSKLLIGLAVIAVIFVGYKATQSSETPVAVIEVTPAQTEATITKNSEDSKTSPTLESDLALNADLDSTMDSVATTNISGQYLNYDPAAVSASEAEHIVLSFSATWCPSCRTLDKDINESLTDIPGGVEIYKVDYDTNVALRQKYGVTTQHTQVIVTSDGTMISKWVGGSKLEDVLAKL